MICSRLLTRLIFLKCVFLFSNYSLAQTEIKINPLAFLNGSFDAYCEVGITKKWSIEARNGFSTSKTDQRVKNIFRVMGTVKYFFKPSNRIDNFYVAPYLKFQEIHRKAADEKSIKSRLSSGILLGYKLVSKQKIVFEIAAGAGRIFASNYIYRANYIFNKSEFIGHVKIGYQLGK